MHNPRMSLQNLTFPMSCLYSNSVFPLVPTQVGSGRYGNAFRVFHQVVVPGTRYLLGRGSKQSEASSFTKNENRHFFLFVKLGNEENGWIKTAPCVPSLTKSHRPSSWYTIASTSSFVVVYMLHTNDVTGRSTVLL